MLGVPGVIDNQPIAVRNLAGGDPRLRAIIDVRFVIPDEVAGFAGGVLAVEGLIDGDSGPGVIHPVEIVVGVVVFHADPVRMNAARTDGSVIRK